MFKLKYKVAGEEPEVEYFETLQEVAEHMKFLCEAENIEDVLKCEKEHNIRFYITRIKGE